MSDHAEIKMTSGPQMQAVNVGSLISSVTGLINLIPPSVLLDAKTQAVHILNTVVTGFKIAIPASPGGLLAHMAEQALADAVSKALAQYEASLAAPDHPPDHPPGVVTGN